MRTEWILAVSILSATVGLMILGIGYWLGKRRAFEMMNEPEGYYVMANFYLAILKSLDENKYAIVRDGIAMRARHQVYSWRMYEKNMSAKQLEEIRKRLPSPRLIENAEKWCGTIDFPDKPKPSPWFHLAEKMMSDLRGKSND